MLLVTTTFSDLWDSEKETFLFLAPWCTRYDRKNDWQSRQHVVLKNPWDDRDRLYQDAIYCEKIIDRMLEELTQYLNAAHETCYQPRYWRVLLGPWLYFYIHSMYGRYALIKSALEAYPSITTRGLPQAEFTVPDDMVHFMALLQKDRYNLQLCSLICLGLGVPCTLQSRSSGVSDDTSVDRGSTTKGLVGSWQKTIKQKAKQGLYPLTNFLCMWRRKPIVIADPVFSLSHRVSWNLSIRARGATGLLYSSFKPDERFGAIFDKRREGLRELGTCDGFTKLLVDTFPLSFPTLYLEGYHWAREKALGGWSYTPRVCAASAAWYSNERFKFLVAEWSERKCRLIGIQNGGGYGTLRYLGAERHERKICDRFFACGWSCQDSDGRAKDLPSHLLAGASSSPRRSRKVFAQVLLVATNPFLYQYRLDSLPQASQIEEYIQWRIRFISALRGKARENLLLRRVPIEYGWCEVDRVRDACGNIQYDDMKASLVERLRRVRLAVIDHQTTACLEALALNIPCILFWNLGHWEAREEATPFFDALRECGILYDNPEKASAKVLEVYDNPRAWWESEPVQAGRRYFTDRFALGRKDWMKCWVKALEEEMALSQVES